MLEAKKKSKGYSKVDTELESLEEGVGHVFEDDSKCVTWVALGQALGCTAFLALLIILLLRTPASADDGADMRMLEIERQNEHTSELLEQILQEQISARKGGSAPQRATGGAGKRDKILIVGCGLTGGVIANLHANRGGEVHIIEKREHIGGNVYDYLDEETGFRVSRYGPHFFHTKNLTVWNFVNKMTKWTPFELRVQANITDIEDRQVNITVPPNIETVNTVFHLNIKDEDEMNEWLAKTQVKYDHPPRNAEEMALSRAGEVLYEKIFKGYTTKQWEKDPKDLYPSITARIPIYATHDPRYFPDEHQGIPVEGYTSLILGLLDHENIKYRLFVDFFDLSDKYLSQFDKIFYTGPIDAYFASKGMPKLEYRSLKFKRKQFCDIKVGQSYQPTVQYNQPHRDFPFTRTTEYKLLPWLKPDNVCGSMDMKDCEGAVVATQRTFSRQDCAQFCRLNDECLFWSFNLESELCSLRSRCTPIDAAAVSGERGECIRDDCTVVFEEYPSSDGEPYYPIPDDRNTNLYNKYKKMSMDDPDVLFVGRLASYKYFNMDAAIDNALTFYQGVYNTPSMPSCEQSLVVITVLKPDAVPYKGCHVWLKDGEPDCPVLDTVSVAECSQKCVDNAQCTSFTVKEGTNQCTLKACPQARDVTPRGAEGSTTYRCDTEHRSPKLMKDLCTMADQFREDGDIFWIVVLDGEYPHPEVRDFLFSAGVPHALMARQFDQEDRALGYMSRNQMHAQVYFGQPGVRYGKKFWKDLRELGEGRAGYLGDPPQTWAAVQPHDITFDSSLIIHKYKEGDDIWRGPKEGFFQKLGKSPQALQKLTKPLLTLVNEENYPRCSRR